MHGRIWLNTKCETLKKEVCKFLLKLYNIISIFSCKVQQYGGVRRIIFFQDALQVWVGRVSIYCLFRFRKSSLVRASCSSSCLPWVWSRVMPALVSPGPAKPYLPLGMHQLGGTQGSSSHFWAATWILLTAKGGIGLGVWQGVRDKFLICEQQWLYS